MKSEPPAGGRNPVLESAQNRAHCTLWGMAVVN